MSEQENPGGDEPAVYLASRDFVNGGRQFVSGESLVEADLPAGALPAVLRMGWVVAAATADPTQQAHANEFRQGQAQRAQQQVAQGGTPWSTPWASPRGSSPS